MAKLTEYIDEVTGNTIGTNLLCEQECPITLASPKGKLDEVIIALPLVQRNPIRMQETSLGCRECVAVHELNNL